MIEISLTFSRIDGIWIMATQQELDDLDDLDGPPLLFIPH